MAPLVALPVVSAIFFLGFIAYRNWEVRDQRAFLRNGVTQIQPAAEMDTLFEDCRHFISYSGSESVSTWNAKAYFGGRYELTMQVPVEIKSARSGSMIEEPAFYLNEVEKNSVSSSGQVGASYSRNLNFGAGKWQQVYSSGGDFSSIGFTVETTAVPDFLKFANAGRPSD